MSNKFLKELTINNENLHKFLIDDKVSLDSIFNEIDELYGMPSPDDIINNILNEADDPNDIANKFASDNNAMMAKELEINQKLQGEVYATANLINNPQAIQQVVQNPKQFIANNKTALSTMPQENRKEFITNVNQMQQINNGQIPENAEQLGLGMQNMQQQAMFLNPNGIPQQEGPKGILGYLGLTIRYLTHVEMVGRMFNPTQSLVMKFYGSIFGFGKYIINALFRGQAGLVANSIKYVETDITPSNFKTIVTNAVKDGNENLLNSVASMTGVTGENLKDIVSNGSIKQLQNSFFGKFKSSQSIVNGTVQTATELPKVNLPENAGVSGYNERAISTVVAEKWKWVIAGILVALLLIWMFKWLRNKNTKKRQEQFAMMNGMMTDPNQPQTTPPTIPQQQQLTPQQQLQIAQANAAKQQSIPPQQEITIPMLCEYFEDDAQYIMDMEFINESIIKTLGSGLKGIWNFVRSPIKTSKAILTSGNNALVGITQETQHAINNKTISPFMAKICNVLVSLGILVLAFSVGYLSMGYLTNTLVSNKG